MDLHHKLKRRVWAGLVLVLVGAILAIAPHADAVVGDGSGSSGNLSCADITSPLGLLDVVTVKDDVQRQAPFPDPAGGEVFHTFTDGGVTVSYRFVANPAPGSSDYVVEFKDATALIFGYLIKQASDNQNLSRHGLFANGVTSGVITFGEAEFSHLDFCTGRLGTTTSTGPSTTTTTVASTTTTGAETTTTGAETTTTGGGTSTTGSTSPTTGVTTTSGPSSTSTSTSTTSTTTTPTPGDASLQVVKAVAGAVPSAWTFQFIGDAGSFQLDHESGVLTITGLAPGNYTIAEVLTATSSLVGLACDTDAAILDPSKGTATVSLEAGRVVQCTFTNFFPVVLDDTVTSTTTPAAVLPDVVERTDLPRTGASVRVMTAIGVILMLAGAALVVESARKLADRAGAATAG